MVEKKFLNLESLDYGTISYTENRGLNSIWYNTSMYYYDLFGYQNIFRSIYLEKFASDSRLETLAELTAIDKLANRGIITLTGVASRFRVILILTSSLLAEYYFKFHFDLSITKSNQIFSLKQLYSASGWLERECWDMFGIVFIGNGDLRRLLTDYGFTGFPLRKDFPVVGFLETRYDEELSQLCTTKLSLAQEFRLYTLQSPF